MTTPAERPAWLCLLHFDRPFHHAGHALVATMNIARLATHPPRRHRMLCAAYAAGIRWRITASVRVSSFRHAKTLRIQRSRVMGRMSGRLCPACRRQQPRTLLGALSAFNASPAPILARLGPSQDPDAPAPD